MYIGPDSTDTKEKQQLAGALPSGGALPATSQRLAFFDFYHGRGRTTRQGDGEAAAR